MTVLILFIRPFLLKLIGSCEVKKLIVEILEKYVKMTDNDIDDVLAATVKTALLKGC